MDNKYGGIIWTDHVLDRLKERGIKQSDAWVAWKNPDRSKFSRSKGVWVYEKNIGRRSVEIAAKKNDRAEWVVVSAWSKPSGAKKSSLITVLIRKIKGNGNIKNIIW